MKIKLAILLVIASLTSFADTNVLELTWSQPIGYQSTLYTSTNLGGAWQPLSTNPPPFTTVSDKSVAFFYVVVSPTNNIKTSFSGSGVPDLVAPAGATFIGTNEPVTFWFKVSDESNQGWVQGI